MGGTVIARDHKGTRYYRPHFSALTNQIAKREQYMACFLHSRWQNVAIDTSKPEAIAVSSDVAKRSIGNIYPLLIYARTVSLLIISSNMSKLYWPFGLFMYLLMTRLPSLARICKLPRYHRSLSSAWKITWMMRSSLRQFFI